MKKYTLHTFAIGLLMTLSSIVAQAQVSIPTLASNEKYTVLMVTPDQQGMTPQQKQMIAQVKTEVNSLTGEISIIAGQALSADKGINKIFVNLAETLKSRLAPRLDLLKASLPLEDAMYLSVYILPWQANPTAPQLKLTMLDMVQQTDVDLTLLKQQGRSKEAELYAKINSKIRDLKLTETDKFQLQSIAIHLKLVRGDSQIRVQLLGRLKQMKVPFVKDNEQVHIKAIEIFGNEAKKERPMMLVNIIQNLQNKSRLLPEIVMEFGQFGGVSGGYNGWKGAYQILTNPWSQNDCQSKLNSTPALTGTLAKSAAGNNMIAKALGRTLIDGTAIKFRILNLRIDAATLKILKMNLAVEVGSHQFPQCLAAESINTQFQVEANAAIEAHLKTLYKQDDMTDDLMASLYN